MKVSLKKDVLPKEESPDGATKPDNQFDFYTILPETESTVTEQGSERKLSHCKKR